MNLTRSGGVLLHPTSLPGPYGVGELGEDAFRWIDFLSGTGCGLWQVLPLGPTGYGDSPYQTFSAFAGNPYLISIGSLLKDGLLVPDDLTGKPGFNLDRVDFGAIYRWKPGVLSKAFEHFTTGNFPALEVEFERFQKKQADWLPEFSLFMALKEAHFGAPWTEWEPPFRGRDRTVLKGWQARNTSMVERFAFWQFLFFRQWKEVRRYAHHKGVYLIGDVPIFTALDSADVWSHQELFFLDSGGRPTVVAGVPPDYFSETGQLWGNPLYRWETHLESRFSWWVARMKSARGLVDFVRLDHFRGFEAYWEVPASEENAMNGRWVKAPGDELLRILEEELGELPIIAEDLGEITPEVIALREKYQLPGMKILVFAFSEGPENPFLPHHFPEHCVVYTGTHDNDTARGWFDRIGDEERRFARGYLGTNGEDIAWDLIRLAWGSVAKWSLAPLQDFLGLGNEARMNYPGNPVGNWSWRFRWEALDDDLRERVENLNFIFSRSSV